MPEFDGESLGMIRWKRLKMVEKFLNYFLFLYLKYENRKGKVEHENELKFMKY